MSDEPDHLPAGDFGRWLDDVRAAIRGERTADVPCGTCTACCTSSQFVHIGPDEADTLARIPPELLFPAPGLPEGTVLLGYDERGHCPMLVDDRCSIYEDRPRTCRTYDCRVFPAAAIEPDDAQAAIAERTRRWRFSYPTEEDRIRHGAVRAAAAWVAERPEGTRLNATQVAVRAIEISDRFAAPDG